MPLTTEYKINDRYSWRDTHPLNAPLHQHEHIELLLIRHGTLTAKTVSEEYTMSDGDIAVFFPYTVHGYETVSESFDYYMLIFTPNELGDVREIFMNEYPESPVIPKADVPPDVNGLVHDFNETNYWDKSKSYLLNSLLRLIAARLLPLMTLVPTTAENRTDNVVKLVRFMSEHYTEPITLDSVAEELGISRYAASRIFNNRLHAGFPRYLNSLRIEQAKRLLSMTVKPIIDIALDCGYDNLRTFNRVFSESENMSPRQYRKNLK